MLIYSYINTRENWKNSKLCENTPPFGRRVSTQFLVFPISTRVDITVYQHGKCFIFLKYNIGIHIQICFRPRPVGNEFLYEFRANGFKYPIGTFWLLVENLKKYYIGIPIGIFKCPRDRFQSLVPWRSYIRIL